jgi:hypothetical protein
MALVGLWGLKNTVSGGAVFIGLGLLSCTAGLLRLWRTSTPARAVAYRRAAFVCVGLCLLVSIAFGADTARGITSRDLDSLLLLKGALAVVWALAAYAFYWAATHPLSSGGHK